jgi:hypothetical protein
MNDENRKKLSEIFATDKTLFGRLLSINKNNSDYQHISTKKKNLELFKEIASLLIERGADPSMINEFVSVRQRKYDEQFAQHEKIKQRATTEELSPQQIYFIEEMVKMTDDERTNKLEQLGNEEHFWPEELERMEQEVLKILETRTNT